MAYIIPNTDVRILKGVKLDPSYANTIYFASDTAQYTYFASKTKYTLSAQSYQRVELGVIRVQLTEANLHDCSYLMFRNISYENKWFYAFITNTEYINDNTTDVYYEIDRVQSWLFEMTLMPCMIERTHIPSSSDTIGANITPEGVNLGELVYDNQEVLLNLHDTAVIIQVADVKRTPIDPTPLVSGNFYEGLYSGERLWMSRNLDIIAIDNFLDSWKLKPEAILGMYVVPQWCVNRAVGTEVNNTYLPISVEKNPEIISGRRINGNESFGGGFVPNNKKLYTYPYNYFQVLASDGQQMSMRYEFCDDLQPKVMADSCVTAPVQIVVRPTSYKGITKNPEYGDGYNYIYQDYGEHITVSNFPLCSWTSDYYTAWLAQNALPMFVGIAPTLAGMNAMSKAMNPAVLSKAGEITQKKIGHFMQLDPYNPKHQKWFDQLPSAKYSDAEILGHGLPSITDALMQHYQASIHADQFRGSLNTGSADFSNKCINLYERRAHISAEYARMIDAYFDRFGYAIGEIGTVNRNVRPYWTYIKTDGCCIKGDCNARDIQFVESLYDRGITWWTDGDLIGRYDLARDNHA